MTFLTVCAHDLTDDFEKTINTDYQVVIRDKSNEPWSVVFEGDRDNLIAMFNAFWTNGDEDELLDSSSPWLTEVFVAKEPIASQEIATEPVAINDAVHGGILDVSDGFVIREINRERG